MAEMGVAEAERMNEKNILFVHDGENWIRGSERVLLDMVDTLAAAGHKVHVCCNTSAKELIRELSLRQVSTFPVRLNSLLLYGGPNPFALLATCRDIYRIVRRARIDVIHASSGLANQYCLPAARLCRIPLIAHVQGVYLRNARILSLVSYSTLQLFVSKAVAQPYTKNRLRQRILYNGIDCTRFAPSAQARADIRSELGIAPEKTVIGFVGSLERRKGISTIFEVASRLRPDFPQLVFLVVGGGPLLQELGMERDAMGLGDCVFMLGERSDTPEVINAFDLLLCPSSSEAFGLVAAEALSCEVPVIASNVGGLAEIVVEGGTGYLCNHDATGDFVERCKTLLMNPDLRRLLGRQGRQRVIDHFSTDRFRLELLDVYQKLT